MMEPTKHLKRRKRDRQNRRTVLGQNKATSAPRGAEVKRDPFYSLWNFYHKVNPRYVGCRRWDSLLNVEAIPIVVQLTIGWLTIGDFWPPIPKLDWPGIMAVIVATGSYWLCCGVALLAIMTARIVGHFTNGCSTILVICPTIPKLGCATILCKTARLPNRINFGRAVLAMSRIWLGCT